MSAHSASMDANLLIHLALYLGAALAAVFLLSLFTGVHIIPNNRVGIVEKLWSLRGQVREGRLMVLGGETGYQASVLRGGIYFCYWRWQYRIHKVPLTVIPQGKIGYVFARDGEPLGPSRRSPGWCPATISRTPTPSLTGEGNSSGSAASAAGSGRSSAKACMPSTWCCSSSSPKRRSTASPWTTAANRRRSTSGGKSCGPAAASIRSSSAWPDRSGAKAEPRRNRGRHDRHRHRARRPFRRTGRDHRPRRRRRSAGPKLPQQLPGHRGLPPRRRPTRPAICPADRRHLLHQPLVRHGGVDPQDDRPDRLRRRGRQLLRQAGAGPLRPRVPPRRAGGRGLARRVDQDALPRQIPFQHLRRPRPPRADHELRAALDHRPHRDAPLRRIAASRSTW